MNHNPATEQEVGFLHKLVTELHSRRLRRMLELMDDPDKPVDPEYAIDEKYLRIVQKFLTDNSITAMPDAESKGGGLNDRVAQIRARMSGKVLDFQSEAREKGKG